MSRDRRLVEVTNLSDAKPKYLDVDTKEVLDQIDLEWEELDD